VGFPSPSSGGILVAQILNILEHFDLRSIWKCDPAVAYHVIGEAMKLAFADRAHWLGDADFVQVPRGLIAKPYAATLARRIDLGTVIRVDGPGQPPGWQSAHFGKHTTHVAVADQEGYWVAITATINTSFGAKVIVPGTGLLLNNEMDDFSAQPGTPNAFGLVGTTSNAIAPGKRPLSSMSPTIVLKDGRPILTVGAAGGPMIITQVVLAIVGYLDWQLPLDRTLEQGRIHHQWSPDLLFIEQSIPRRVADSLRCLGHRVRVVSQAGVVQAIGASRSQWLVGVHDPGVPGRAAGF
jgi:gamma-glutamyltranspeptidase/glutathione hydrolase